VVFAQVTGSIDLMYEINEFISLFVGGPLKLSIDIVAADIVERQPVK
jgi:hypothetical protein